MNEKIDFVMIWVDGNDENWQREKNKYDVSKKSDASIVRYREWDNLKYWFRAVEKFAPWVNKVHFVTCGHIPSFLNLKNPKLNFVKHSDYMNKEFLPTFSANPIELNLHKIKGLSEKFVFFNDDMFLTDNTKPEDFFKDGYPCDSLAFYPYFPKDKIMDKIVFNDVAIINKYFKKKSMKEYLNRKYINISLGKQLFQSLLLMPFKSFTGFYDPHIPQSFTKSLFKEVWSKEEELLYNTSMNKFRNENDVNQWLIRYWYLAQGNFSYRSPKVGKYFEITDDNEELYDSIKSQKYKMVCCNDNGNYKDFEYQKDELKKVFNNILPNKSSFEI